MVADSEIAISTTKHMAGTDAAPFLSYLGRLVSLNAPASRDPRPGTSFRIPAAMPTSRTNLLMAGPDYFPIGDDPGVIVDTFSQAKPTLKGRIKAGRLHKQESRRAQRSCKPRRPSSQIRRAEPP